MIKSFIRGIFVLLLVLVIASQAWSAKPPGGHLNITEVEVDLSAGANGQITIMGEDLDFGGALDVTLGDFGSLAIVGAPTPTMIVADLPAGIPEGDFLLTVSRGNGQSQNDEYDLTIGAVGSVEQLRILRGEVRADGSQVAGVGFTSAKIATGHYRITFNHLSLHPHLRP